MAEFRPEDLTVKALLTLVQGFMSGAISEEEFQDAWIAMGMGIADVRRQMNTMNEAQQRVDINRQTSPNTKVLGVDLSKLFE